MLKKQVIMLLICAIIKAIKIPTGIAENLVSLNTY